MLISNSGLDLNVHYCGDEVASISLKMPEKPLNVETNCCGIADEGSNCCNDKSFQIQETSDKFQENITNIEFNAIVVVSQNMFVDFFEKPNYKVSKALNFYPFLDNLPPIYKRNCQLIFYA